MLLIDSQVEITTKIRKFVPEDAVDLICCFVPKIINKRTKKMRNKHRRRRAFRERKR